MERKSQTSLFGGSQETWAHASKACEAEMRFSVYLPPQARAEGAELSVLYWLSGLTCNEDNFMQKAGAQRVAAELGLILVAPDTSPRIDVAGDSESYDFGKGAGFYVNATQTPWAGHYQMYDYVLNELPAVVEKQFPANSRRSLSGHSMGGHGALVLALRNPGRFQSVSAFAPIVAPSQCPWGEKALTGYLGSDRATWKAYDATELVLSGISKQELFVDQGLDDKFLAAQLKPELLEQACSKMDHPLRLRRHSGYDHSYFFISTFIEDHLRYHAQRLEKAES